MAAFERCWDEDLGEAERRAALQTVFFAAGNDPRPWLDGWWPEGRAIGEAMRRSDWREWWRGGDAPVLILQPVEDAMGPLEVGRELALELGRRARYVELTHCGHAILPERPEEVAAILVDFLRDVG
jgi:pimeloyl-ACP methyl ester carboxylesterase